MHEIHEKLWIQGQTIEMESMCWTYFRILSQLEAQHHERKNEMNRALGHLCAHIG